jgi:hypothetical protein
MRALVLAVSARQYVDQVTDDPIDVRWIGVLRNDQADSRQPRADRIMHFLPFAGASAREYCGRIA